MSLSTAFTFAVALLFLGLAGSVRVGSDDHASLVANMTGAKEQCPYRMSMATGNEFMDPDSGVKGCDKCTKYGGPYLVCEGTKCSYCQPFPQVDPGLEKKLSEAGYHSKMGCQIYKSPGEVNWCCVYNPKESCDKTGDTESEWKTKAREYLGGASNCPTSTGQSCSAVNAIGNWLQGQGQDGCHTELNAKCDESDKMCKCNKVDRSHDPFSDPLHKETSHGCFDAESNTCITNLEYVEKHMGRSEMWERMPR